MPKNINRIYWLNFTWMFLLIQAIIVPFFQSRGLTMTQVFMVQTVFSLILGVLDIPTGYVSDLIGRKKTLILGSLLKALGGFLLYGTQGLEGLILSYVVIGVANSLYSGSDVALLYETYEAMPEKIRPKLSGIFGKRVFFVQMGTMSAALIGGAFASYSIDLVVLLNAIFACVPFLIVLSLKEMPRLKMAQRAHFKNIRQVFFQVFQTTKILRQLVVASMFYGAAPVIAVYAFQGLWRSAHVPLIYFGYFSALANLTGAFSGRAIPYLQMKIGNSGVLFLIGLLPICGFLGATQVPIIFSVLMGLLLEIGRGFSQAILNDQFNTRITSDIRATANSIVSFGNRLIVSISGPVIGWAADHYGFSTSFNTLGLFYLLILIILGRPLMSQLKALN